MNARQGLPGSGQHGFTLVEIIITLTVASIMAAMLVQLMGSSLSRSVEPIQMVQDGLELNEVIENITADYIRLSATEDSPLPILEGRIEAGNDSGNTPYYGDYSVDPNEIRFITFDEVDHSEETDASGTSNTLKVKISSPDGGQSLTVLFTQ